MTSNSYRSIDKAVDATSRLLGQLNSYWEASRLRANFYSMLILVIGIAALVLVYVWSESQPTQTTNQPSNSIDVRVTPPSPHSSRVLAVVIEEKMTGRAGACGEILKQGAEYAAHYKLKCGTEVTVQSVVEPTRRARLRILDVAGSSRKWDAIGVALSPAAAKQLGIIGRGWVELTVLDKQ